MTLNLDAMKALNLPRMDWRTLVEEKEPLPEQDRKTLADYFLQFVHPIDGECPNCKRQLGGFFGSFTWGIAHGEGRCGCGYPCRAYHRNVGPIEFLQLILPYHPDELTKA